MEEFTFTPTLTGSEARVIMIALQDYRMGLVKEAENAKSKKHKEFFGNRASFVSSLESNFIDQYDALYTEG